MKIKNIRKIISITVAMLMTMSLVSCGFNSEDDGSNLGAVKPNTDKPTDTLVVYGDKMVKYILEPALDTYKKIYPDVKVNFHDFGDDMIKYNETIRTEMAAGKGPDLLLSIGSEFDDIYKTMDTGVFCDLNTFFVSDKEYNHDLYVKSVFDCGVYNNKRYVVPISYRTAPMVTTEEVLAKEGINKESLKSFKDFSKQMNVYIKKYANDQGKTVFFRQKQSLYAYMPWSGVSYIDYKDKKINVDTDEFKMVMEAYKDLYRQDWVLGKSRNSSYTGDEVKALRSNHYLFDRFEYCTLDKLCFDYAALLHDQKPIYIPFPTVNGRTIAEPAYFAGITNGSQNKANAYSLLKVLLSEQIQLSNKNYDIPVLKGAIPKKVDDILLNLNGGTPDGSVVTEKIPTETAQKFVEIVSNIDNCEFNSYKPLSIIIELMDPYFKGDVSYENCLKNVKDKLEIYITE